VIVVSRRRLREVWRAHWWRAPLTGRILAGRLFACHPVDAVLIVAWLGVDAVAVSVAIGAYVAWLVAMAHAWWIGVALGTAAFAVVLAPAWVVVSSMWADGSRRSPSESERARRRHAYAPAWADIDGWLEYELERTGEPVFDYLPRDRLDERFDGPGRSGEVGSYPAFLVQVFLAAGRLAEARAELRDIERSLPLATPRARARLRHLTGLVARAEENLADARRAHRASLPHQLAGRHWSDLAASLEALAGIELAYGDAPSCARLAGASAALRERADATTRQPFEELCLRHDVATAEAVLGARYGRHYSEGAELDAAAAVTLALELAGGPRPDAGVTA
jgi:hypothetical protein